MTFTVENRGTSGTTTEQKFLQNKIIWYKIPRVLSSLQLCVKRNSIKGGSRVDIVSWGRWLFLRQDLRTWKQIFCVTPIVVWDSHLLKFYLSRKLQPFSSVSKARLVVKDTRASDVRVAWKPLSRYCIPRCCALATLICYLTPTFSMQGEDAKSCCGWSLPLSSWLRSSQV